MLPTLKLRYPIALSMQQQQQQPQHRSNSGHNSKHTPLSSKTHTNEAIPSVIDVRGGNHAADDVRTMAWRFKQTKKHSVSVPLPLQTLAEHGKEHDSFTLHYKRGAKVVVS